MSRVLDRLRNVFRPRGPSPEASGAFVVAENDDATVIESDPTWVMRNSPYPLWVAVREKLVGLGVDPSGAVVAVSFSESDATEVGVVVAPPGLVFSYRFALAADDDAWQFSKWEDVTDRWADAPYAADVEAALGVVRSANA